jgi:predicted double-glycine peptidase
MSRLRLSVAALGALVLGGCTSVANFRGIPFEGEGLYVGGVPPLRQDDRYACGPACLAAVAIHWGVPLADFKAKCPAVPEDTTGQQLQKLAESLGLQAFVFEGSMADLEDNLRQGRPMIVMLTKPPDPAIRRMGLLGGLGLALSEHVAHPAHWVVVIGLTGDHAVIVHDPASGLLQIKVAAFQRWWAQQRNLCVLVAGM